MIPPMVPVPPRGAISEGIDQPTGDEDRVLVRRGLLQCCKLAVEQRNRHEVLVPCDHTPADKLVRSFEIDQHDVAAAANDDVAIVTGREGPP
jgi:hypothetical protein